METRTALTRFLAVPFRLRTYGSILYSWAAFPLGLAYFVLLVVGFSAGVPLTIVWVGFAILLALFSLAWVAEGLERQMAIHLLGASVPPRIVHRVDASRRFAGLRTVAGSTALWKGLLFLFLKFPLGLASFVFSLVALVVPVAFLLAPMAVAWGAQPPQIFWWSPSTVAEALPLSLLGLVGLYVSLHLHVALGWLWARLAEHLLGAGAPQAAAPILPPKAEPAIAAAA